MHYRLALTPDDEAACLALFNEADIPTFGIEYPTVMLIDANGVLVGALTTCTRNDFIEAGPLVLTTDTLAKGAVLCELLEHYETALAAAGVNAYTFSVPHGSRWSSVVQTMLGDPVDVTPSSAWYVRRLGGPPIGTVVRTQAGDAHGRK